MQVVWHRVCATLPPGVCPRRGPPRQVRTLAPPTRAPVLRHGQSPSPMPPRTLPLTLLRPFLDPRSKERFVDLRKARDLDDLGKQKQALLGFPNESIVPPRNDALPSDTMDITLAHVNKMMSAKTVPPQLNQFPCLSASASTTTSATSSPPPRASTLGRTWQGRGWNLRLHRTKVHLKRS